MLRRGLMAAAAVLLLGAAFLALAPFDHGAGRCGAPLFGAETRMDDQPAGTAVIPDCGDAGVRRLVDATGLFAVGMTVVVALALQAELKGG